MVNVDWTKGPVDSQYYLGLLFFKITYEEKEKPVVWVSSGKEKPWTISRHKYKDFILQPFVEKPAQPA